MISILNMWVRATKPQGDTLRDFFADQFKCDTPELRVRVLDVVLVKQRVAYMAVEAVTPEGRTVKAYAVSIKMPALRERKYNDDLRYYVMSEDDLPVADECPEKILKLLTPAERYDAHAWRQRCIANLSKTVEKKNKRWVLKEGDCLYFDPPRQFAFGRGRKAIRNLTPVYGFQVYSTRPLRFKALEGDAKADKYVLNIGNIDLVSWHIQEGNCVIATADEVREFNELREKLEQLKQEAEDAALEAACAPASDEDLRHLFGLDKEL